jgi:hypothetical protein
MNDKAAKENGDSAAAVEVAASALAAQGHATIRCHNCGSPIIGPFCAICGQERDTHRRSVWSLMGDLFEDIISFDSRILRTGVALMAEPGEIAAAFREGRPHRYVPALRLYFFVSLLFFVILSASGLAIMQFQIVARPEKIVHNTNGYFVVSINPDPAVAKPDLVPVSKKKAEEPGTKYEFSEQTHFFSPVGAYHSDLTPDARAKLLDDPQNGAPHSKAAQGGWTGRKITDAVSRLAADPAALNEPLTAWLPRVLFLLLPLFALLLMLFYFRKRKDFYYVDHLIFSLNMHSFVFIVLVVAVGVAQVLDSGWVAFGAVVAMGLYFLFAMKRFYGQSWFWTGLKFVSIGFLYCFFFLGPAMLAVIAASIFWA